jgi:hypothetical protein
MCITLSFWFEDAKTEPAQFWARKMQRLAASVLWTICGSTTKYYYLLEVQCQAQADFFWAYAYA